MQRLEARRSRRQACSPIERIFRLGELRVNLQRGLEILPRAVEIMFSTIGLRPVEEYVRNCGIERQRLAEIGKRLVDIAFSGKASPRRL
jgi:hypothetical protein